MRNHDMFGFLASEASSKNVGLDLIRDFAKEAASAFLGNSQSPLNYTIQNIAKSENLTPDHISILCQEANKEVHSQMFKTASNKYIDFELADPSVIVSNLEESLTSKTASAEVPSEGLDDFNHAPYEKRAYHEGDFQMVGSVGHNGLKTPEAHLKKVAMEKKASQLKSLQEDLFILDTQINGVEKKIIKIARDQVLPYPLQERPEKLSEVGCFLKSAGLDMDLTKNLVDLTALVLKKQGYMEKSADVKADPKYISENLNATVRNGTHPLEIHVKTLVDKRQRKEALQNKFNLIKTELDEYGPGEGAITGQRVKEL